MLLRLDRAIFNYVIVVLGSDIDEAFPFGGSMERREFAMPGDL
jgi:hypothetical protein